MRLLSYLLKMSQWPQRVLGISKLCAFELLKAVHPDLSDNQLLDQLRKLSKECDEIIAEHRRQLACERELARVLRNLDVSYRIIKRIGDASRYVDWADLVIVMGGDGTFLLASRLITSNRTPIFGINPHPGDNNLTMPMECSADIDGIFERLRAGDYGLLMRSRIRTIMTGVGLYRALASSAQKRITDNAAVQPRRRVLPWLALNEANDEQELMIRSSGMRVYTGSGSRVWLRETNLQLAQTIRTIVAMATGKGLSGNETGELLHKYRSNLLFPPDEPRMTYAMYEMYRGTRCSGSLSEGQRCRTVRVKSLGFDAGLILDGCVCMPFNDGSTALFEIRPEYSLRNIVLR